MTVRLGLLGAGRIGKVHAAAIAAVPGASLVAVADAFPDAARALAASTGAEVREADAIMAASDIDAVLITTPTDLHATMIEQAAKAGKAIFCEKPIDLDVQRVRDCLAVVAKAGVPLMVGFNRRFDPNFVEVRRQIDAGTIGKVEMVSITSRDPAPPPADYIKRSGGLFRDMTIHDFDMARFLLGEEPVSVFASASVLVDPVIGELGDYDSASVVLTTASGRIAQISNTRRATYGYDQRIEVLGEKGLVSAENLRATNVEVANAEGYRREPLLNFFMTRYTEAYRAEIAAFIATIAAGKPVSPSGEDGLRALLLAEAALRSAKEKRAIEVAA
ncbi:inositol 2-dehydrogenase [Kaistia geumhonensis]|uniref:Myo-inositol 2-dehydrogenase/D-chiro-inositol 1-dehydrogenase n=1 Tax=Kaistia geumhonensis TaxID=410839 RepID=A0ABU0MBQ0_9HYPH|nr:inositol 2-dehydrogenase [Kaistia geumhonensis]MCX5481332.1 inositol 2-dehydrogenase [Kaistia geumhonensis]MDQ0518393.1 myo-inositol 2-dehydrogenase/D-chiro-inositol 1-dehydrogenase [Kaistia geumhonensis]